MVPAADVIVSHTPPTDDIIRCNIMTFCQHDATPITTTTHLVRLWILFLRYLNDIVEVRRCDICPLSRRSIEAQCVHCVSMYPKSHIGMERARQRRTRSQRTLQSRVTVTLVDLEMTDTSNLLRFTHVSRSEWKLRTLDGKGSHAAEPRGLRAVDARYC